jgi:hypothetical protein
MASFTDLIPQFNPYIQQLPVDAMVQVGMEKQRRYDEGLQKIQTYVDKVAGLDIAQPIQKEYLQSKLNELGNNLKGVAAGDFSNFQLVNSVGGMIGQISKDPIVQNAVSSTAFYRKQQAEMEKAISEGKSSQANIDDFTEKANEWLNSSDVTATFKSRYTPYIDVKKKALDAIKALHPKLKEYDIPFKVIDGKIDTKQIADAMKRYKIEGIDEGQIKAAISATFTPDDINQLDIDARYQFKGVTSDQLVRRIQLNYDDQKTEAIKTLEYLNGQKNIITDPTEAQKNTDRIAYVEKLLGKDSEPGELDLELRRNLELIRTNPNAVKSAIYKDGFVREFANAFSWKNQSEQYVDNPIKKVEQWNAEMRLKWTTENRLRDQFEVETEFRTKELEQTTITNALKRAELYGDPMMSPAVSLGTPTDARNNADKLVIDFTDGSLRRINGLKQGLRDKGLTDVEINEILNDYKNNTNKAKKKPAWAIGSIMEILRETNTLQAIQDRDEQARSEARATVYKANESLLKDRDAALSAINSGGAVNLQFYDGRTRSTTSVSKTPSQIVQDIQNGIASIRVDKAALGKMAITYTLPNGRIVTAELPKQTFGAQPVGASQMRPAILKVNEYLNKYGSLDKKIKTDEDNTYKDIMAPIANSLLPTLKAVALPKSQEIPPVTAANLSVLLTAADQKQIAADKNFNLVTASGFLSDKNLKNTRLSVYQQGNDFELWLTNTDDPKNIQKLRLDKGTIDRVLNNSGYTDDNTQAAQMLRFGRGSTNPTANPDRAFMQKSFGDFPRVTDFQINADLVGDAINPDLFVPTVFLKAKTGEWVPFEISGMDDLQRVGYDQGRKQLNTLTNSSLRSMLKLQYPNYDFSNIEGF